jgi:phage recombination protein Bet
MELTMAGRGIAIKKENEQLALMRRTVAKDCNDDEFRLFVHICNAVRLDPLRRQAHAFVYNKNDENKRQLTVVTSIGGYRSIAERTGNYRPDDDEPEFTLGEVNERTNPKGIVSCKVKVFKFSHGEWWPVVGTARWDEYVPLVLDAKDDDIEWVDTGEVWADSGKPKKKKIIKKGASVSHVIDPGKQGWIKMPFIMLAKCAEAAALRKAWPDDFAQIHAEEETHREESFDAVAAAEQAEKDRRLALVGGPDTYITDWLDGKSLEAVAGGQYHDRVMEFIRSCKGQPTTVAAWRDRNQHTFNQFWAAHKADALALKKEIEKATTEGAEVA